MVGMFLADFQHLGTFPVEPRSLHTELAEMDGAISGPKESKEFHGYDKTETVELSGTGSI